MSTNESRIERAKREVPIDRLLAHYDAEPESHGWKYQWRAIRCPFHGDTTASASINYDLDRYRCHGCEVGGDILDVVQQAESVDGVMGAVEWIERTFKLTSEPGPLPSGSQKYAPREPSSSYKIED